MKLKKLLSIILSPLVLGSYSASAVRRIPNVVKDRVLKRENRNLSPKRKRSRRKKNKVVNHKVDKKKLKNRTKGKSPLVNFRDSFIKDSKRIWRSIKKNPGKSALITTAAVAGAVVLSNRLPDLFVDDNEAFEQTKNYLIENAIQEKLYGSCGMEDTINDMVQGYCWRFGGSYQERIDENIGILNSKGVDGLEGTILRELIREKINGGCSDFEKSVVETVESFYCEEIESANFLKGILSQKGFEKWRDKELNKDDRRKLENALKENKIAFDKIRSKYFGEYNKDYFENNPDFLVKTLVKELQRILNGFWPYGNYSAFPHTVLHRLWDFFLMRGATTRQRKSAERILYKGKAEGYGSCWELANIVDWFCRKLGFERHNIIAYKLWPGIYHTFNFFVCKGKAYLADPLGGVFEELKLGKDGSLLESLERFRRSQVNGIAPGYGDWYAVEQIEDNTYRTLGMMKMAKFFPNMSDGSRLFKLSETCKNPYCREHKECNNKLNTEKFVINDKSSFIIKTLDGKLILNDKNNINHDINSSLIFG